MVIRIATILLNTIDFYRFSLFTTKLYTYSMVDLKIHQAVGCYWEIFSRIIMHYWYFKILLLVLLRFKVFFFGVLEFAHVSFPWICTRIRHTTVACFVRTFIFSCWISPTFFYSPKNFTKEIHSGIFLQSRLQVHVCLLDIVDSFSIRNTRLKDYDSNRQIISMFYTIKNVLFWKILFIIQAVVPKPCRDCYRWCWWNGLKGRFEY